MSKPKFPNAPGVVVRARLDGTWVVFWQARTDLVERGFRPKLVNLWRGIEPSAADAARIADECSRAQTEMLIWGRGGLPTEAGAYDGTVRGLIHIYQIDANSSFRKLRYRTRQHYDILCRRIARDHGDKLVSEISVRDIIEWHRMWSESGVTMAHALIRMFRGLISFGMSLLEDPACEKLSLRLSKQRFEMGKSRTSTLTADQAIAIRAEAHRRDLHSIALAQAIQFDGMLRQKDVIGEYVPRDEPGLSEITHAGTKWLHGLRWSEIDEHLICRHVTSKRQKLIELDLKLMPMVLEELRRVYPDLDRSKMPASGPVVIYENTDRPHGAYHFRHLWRQIARAVGVPDNIRNMDSRAGAISEATDAGAELEHIRHAATHSDIAMTQKYSRGSAEKTAGVMRKRAEFRKNKSGT